ncbi:MAG TPA: ParB/RepB/Spo0J family partition protein [Candidatus Kapabacteria bacterium]|nr:ParB/RepB/Spo0J family partition protein [Candidatus Kapabacteria bacterium]
MSKTPKINRGLGKGLGALISNVSFKPEEGFRMEGEKDETGLISLIEISKIKANQYQPRTDFDDNALEDLKNSIINHGLIQPITVRKIEDGYELVSGERRLRASTLAGLNKLPCYVIDVNTNVQMLELALIENLLREDLNPVEVASGYQRLIEEYKYTQEQVAERVGKERSTVTNFLRLLRLPASIQDMVRSKKLSFGHARSLVSIDDHAKILAIAEEIIKNNLSVRETEALIKRINSNNKKKASNDKNENSIPQEVLAVINDKADYLRKIFGTNVKIYPKSKSSGTIELQFYSSEDFERIIDLFEKIEK